MVVNAAISLDLVDLEIVPWSHGVNTKSHNDVLRFVQQVPKNSTIMLEGSPNDHAFFNMLSDFLHGKQVDLSGLDSHYKKIMSKLIDLSKTHSKEFIAKVIISEQTFAWLDIIAICRSRGINVVPLESNLLRTQGNKNLGKKTNYLDKQRSFFFREQNMERRVSLALNSRIKKPIFVLVGSMHASFLNERLARNNINVNLRKDIFTTRDYYDLVEYYSRAARKAYEKKDEFGAYYNEAMLVGHLEGLDGLNKAEEIKNAWDRLKQQNEKVKERLQRKLELRRMIPKRPV
jgi:hypothetical protein